MTALNVPIQQHRGLAADWTSNNPTLLAGEFGVETDTGKVKVGDGSAAWTDLPYITGGVTISTSNPQQLDAIPDPGSTGEVSDAGHIHPMPGADDLAVGVTFTGTLAGAGDVEEALVLVDGFTLSGAVDSVNGQTGTVVLDATDVGADVAGAAAAVTTSSIGAVPTARTVNGHALSADVTVSASDITTGTLPIAQVPTGTTSSTVPFGNDSRFTDSRTPNVAGSNDDIMQRKSGGWTYRTPAQLAADLTTLAPLASPTFTGTPAAPTAAVGTATTQIATTAFVGSTRTATNTVPHQPLVDDLRLGPPGLTLAPSAGGAVLSSTTANAVTYLMPCPIWVPEDCQIDALEVWQNIAATDSGATIELGLGPVSQWPFTGTLLLSAGTTSATATAGLRTIGFTATSVKAGLHWGYLKFISSTTAGTSPQFVKFNANPTPLNPYVGTAPAASYPASGTPYGTALSGTAGIPSNLSTPTLSLSNQGYVWITARVYV